jgi:hypothetical protein
MMPYTRAYKFGSVKSSGYYSNTRNTKNNGQVLRTGYILNIETAGSRNCHKYTAGLWAGIA